MCQICSQDFGYRRLFQGIEALLGVESVALAGCLTSRTTGALKCRGLGDFGYEEGVESEIGAELLDLCFTSVNDVTHARDGDGGFGNVGGEDDFAGVGGWGGEEDALLLFRRKGGVERKDKYLSKLLVEKQHER